MLDTIAFRILCLPASCLKD